METGVSLKTLLNDERLLIECPAGLTIGELMDEAGVPLDLRGYILPLNHGLPIRDLDYVTRPGDRITFCVVPQGKGGGAILGAIAMIALAIVAPWAGGFIAGALGFSATGFVAQAIGLGITLVGAMLVQALIPPPSVNNSKNDSVASPLQESPTYQVTGQSNQERKYGVIPRIYGRHKFFPNLMNTPLIENEGKTSRITTLYDFGYGDVVVTDLKIGGLPVNVINPDIRTHPNSLGKNLSLVSKDVAYDQLSYKLEKDQPIVVRTKDKAIAATVDLTFPRGLVSYDGSGNRQSAAASFMVWYRPVGAAAWTRVPAAMFRGVDVNTENGTWASVYDPGANFWLLDNFSGGSKWQGIQIMRNGVELFRGNYAQGGADPIKELVVNGIRYRRGPGRDSSTVNSKYSWTKHELQIYEPVVGDATVLSSATGQATVCAVHVQFPSAGVYEIKVERKSDISTNNTIFNEANLTLIKSFRDGQIIRLEKPHTFLEFSVVASDKISGVVQNLSAVCISRLRWHDGTRWMAPEETRNPAWIAIDILTGTANKTPLRDDQLDMPSWLRLAKLCDEQITTTVNGVTYTTERFTCDVVIDFRSTVQELISSILSGCRAQLIITQSGKYGVLIDTEQTIARQVFTPANSWGFKGNRSFIDKPHGLRVKFMDPDLNWQNGEFIVYNDGYDETNATLFEELNTFGITEYAKAYRYGRYMLAQGIHRSETFTLNVDVENLAVQRGELVHVAHDVPKVGGLYARVKSISGNRVELDQSFDTYPSHYTVRLADGTVRSGAIQRIVNATSFDVDNVTGIDYDDLIVVGQADRVVGRYIVSEISPGNDLTAELTLLPYKPEIYQAEVGPIPDWDPQFGNDLLTADLAVENLKATYTLTYVNRLPFGQVDLNWSTIGQGLEKHLITVMIPGVGEFLIGEPTEQNYRHLFDLLNRPEYAGKVAEITVTPVSKLGNQGRAQSAQIQILTDTTKPKTPEKFAVNVQSEIIEIFWTATDDQDIAYYDLRYTPEVTFPNWNASQHLSRVSWQTNHTSAGARTGTYMLRVTDTSGNSSDILMQRTTVEVLPNINVVTSIDDAIATPTAWPGALSGLVKVGNTVQSSGSWGSVTPDGVYTYSTIVDLGDVYECRVVSLIEAYGASEADFMVSWVPNLLAVRPGLIRATADQWDAWVEVRVASTMTFMSSWVPNLAAIGPISGSAGAQWSDWRPVQVGDYTGRLFQFRIVCRSKDPRVKVVLKSGKIQVDMPDRIWSIKDVAVPPAGVTINFDPAFREPPVLAVTIDGNSNFVVADITARTARSVTLKLVDQSGTAQSGQVDIMAKGYGRQRAAPI